MEFYGSIDSVSGSITASVFTGSFKGDGGNLYNIQASGVTGLNLSQIASGNATASISSTGFTVNKNTQIQGDLSVTGSIIATNYIVSSSVTYMTTSFASGSTAFGDGPTDIHQFSGSVKIEGNLSLNGSPIGTGKLDETTFQSYTSSISSSIGSLSSSIALTDVSQSNRLTTIEGNYATTGSNLFKGSQTISGSIIPSVDNTYDLGSPTYQWRDVYISSGSLYIDGTKVLGSTSQELTITTDTGQSIKILEAGSDSIILQSADGDIELKSSGGGDILFDPTSGLISIKGTTQIQDGFKITSSGGTNIVFGDSVIVSGSIELTGNVDGIDLQSFSSSVSASISSLLGGNTSLSSSIATTTSGLSSSINSLSSSVATTTSGLTSTITSVSSSLTSSIGSLSSSLATTTSGLSSSIGSLSSSIATTTSGLSSSIATTTSGLSSSVGSLSSSIATTTSGLSSSVATTTSELSSSIGSLSSSIATTTSGLTSTITSLSSSLTSSIGSLSSSINSTIGSLSSSVSASIGNLSSSVATITSELSSSIGSLSSSITTTTSGLSSSIATTTLGTKNRVDSIETTTGSLNTFSSSINTTIKSKLDSESVISGSIQVIITGTTGYSTFSSSVSTSIGALSSSVATTTSGLSSSIDSLSSSVATTTSGLSSSIGSLSSSVATTTLGTKNRVDSIESKTGSYATTGSNIFQGDQTITGSLYVSQNLIIAGSSSIQNISSSVLNIADNIITVNALNPSVRFGGLAVIDSGSSPQVSGSMLFDSVNNQWLFVHQNQASVTSSVLLMGPETYNNLGNESYITANRLVKSTGIEHLTNSNISDDGTTVTMLSNTIVNGTFSATGTTLVSGSSQITFNGISGLPTLVSGSSQINHNTTTNYVANQHIDHTSVSISAGNGLSGGGDISTTRTITLDTSSATFTTGVKTKLNADGVVSGSSQISFNGITDKPTLISGSAQISFNGITDKPTLVSGSSQITFNGISGLPTLVSGSAQISHDSTTGYVANRHIDHTSVSISAGNGLSGGGDISSTRTLTLDTASSTFTTGVKSKLNADGVVSGSSQVSFNGITDKPTLVSGSSQITFSGISGLPTLVSGSSQISYTGLSNIPGGIVSGSAQVDLTATTNYSTGIKTRLNAEGVLSGSAQVVASLPSGTVSGSAQITLSSTTGFGTYLDQGVLTTSSPTFSKVTVNGADNPLLVSNSSSSQTFAWITNTKADATYSYLRLTTASGDGYIIKNRSTGNSIGASSLYLWNSDAMIEFVPSGLTANRTTIATNGDMTVRGNFGASNFSGTHSGSSSGTNTGDQTSVSGNAGTVTNGVYTTGDQSISGTKTFAVIKGDSGADYPHSFTNTDAGNIHWTNRGNRMLTSNGTNWASDGKDPIMAIVGSTADTTRGRMIGITFHNDNNTDNAFSPTISFSAKSNSTSYNSQYASIYGRKTGTASTLDTNWNKGELHFTVHGDTAVSDTPTLLMTQTSSTFGTTVTATSFTTNSGQTGTVSGNAYPTSPNSYFGLRHGSMGASSAEYMIISANADTYISCATGSSVYLRPSGNSSANGVVSTTGAFRPETNNSIDLGTASYRWKTVYMMDLSLSNGIGDYTIVEGEEKLYLYNNKNNKVYSFVLQEEDPTTAPPKKI